MWKFHAHRSLVVVCALLLLPLAARSDDAVSRHALLVGVDYGTSQHLSYLRHPGAEIAMLAEILPLVGYPSDNITLLLPEGKSKTAKLPTTAALRTALANLTRGRKREDVIVFAFSGHLVQWRDGDCYLCGSDARPNDKASMLPLSEVYTALKDSQAGTRIVLLDGCRKNAVTQGGESIQKVAHPQDLTPPPGVTVLFATSAGEVSSERSEQEHGLFFQAVIEAFLGAQGLEQAGRVTVEDLERYVCRRVVTASAAESGKQTPEFCGLRRGDVARVPLESRSGLGALLGPVDSRTKQDWNVPYGRPQIRFTVPGSGARRAGLQPGCVVLEVDGAEVPSVAELVRLLGQKKIGDTVKLGLVSEGQRQTRTVRLLRLPDKAVWAAQVRQLAAEGNSEAIYQVGQDYLEGLAVKRDDSAAVKWFTQAATKNHAGAQAQLGYLHIHGLGVKRDLGKGEEWLRKAIAQDNPDACVTLAHLYYQGEGVTQSDAEAYRYYRKGADQSHRVGQYNVALLLLAGRGVSKDINEGIAWLKKAADQGHPQAQIKLGEMYQSGEEVTKDIPEAEGWFRKALEGVRALAERGDSDSMVDLGNMYHSGQGVPVDDKEALTWYRKSADADNRRAWHNLGVFYRHGYAVTADPAEAARWYRKAADAGLALSQYHLGLLYYTGVGVAKDRAEAARWHRKAVEQGLAAAQFELASLTANGDGVPRDEVEAVKLYKLAVNQQHSAAMNNLGWMYQRGLGGLAKNEKEAYRLFRLAAEKRLPMGMYNLATSYVQGSGTKQDVPAGIRWFKDAVELGEPFAMNDLAALYDHGTLVEQDYAEALRLYKLAAEKKFALAMRNLGNMYQHGRGVTVDRARALEWYRKASDLGDTESARRIKLLEGADAPGSAPGILGD